MQKGMERSIERIINQRIENLRDDVYHLFLDTPEPEGNVEVLNMLRDMLRLLKDIKQEVKHSEENDKLKPSPDENSEYDEESDDPLRDLYDDWWNDRLPELGDDFTSWLSRPLGKLLSKLTNGHLTPEIAARMVKYFFDLLTPLDELDSTRKLLIPGPSVPQGLPQAYLNFGIKAINTNFNECCNMVGQKIDQLIADTNLDAETIIAKIQDVQTGLNSVGEITSSISQQITSDNDTIKSKLDSISNQISQLNPSSGCEHVIDDISDVIRRWS